MPCAESLPDVHWPRSERFSAPRSPSRWWRIRSILQGAWRSYWRRRTERATFLILQSLEDRALKDIGLDRSEIESVVYGGGGRRPGYRCRSAASPSAVRRIGMDF